MNSRVQKEIPPGPYPVPRGLLDALEALFPKPVIEPGMDFDDLMFQAGQQNIINWLRDQHEQSTGG